MFLHSERVFIKGFPKLSHKTDRALKELAEFLHGGNNVTMWSFVTDNGFESFIYPNSDFTFEYHG